MQHAARAAQARSADERLRMSFHVKHLALIRIGQLTTAWHREDATSAPFHVKLRYAHEGAGESIRH